MSTSPQRGLTGRKALWVTGFAIVAGLLVFLLGRAFIVAREAARFDQCTNNLKQIGLALHNYHDVYGCFPQAILYDSDGKPWRSWRMAIVPFVEASSLYEQYNFDEPWNGPSNSALAAQNPVMPYYRCPSDDTESSGVSYFAVVGDDTMWPADRGATMDDAGARGDQIILVVEVANSGIHWMEPRDLSFDTMSFTLNGEGESISSGHTEPGILPGQPQVNALFVDGHVEAIPADTPPDALRSMLLRNAP